MKQWAHWLGLALLLDFAWIYLLFLLRKTKWFIAAWVLGMVVACTGVLFGVGMVFVLIGLSSTAGEAGLGAIGAIMGIVLAVPFFLLALLYVRAYRRYREEEPTPDESSSTKSQ